MSQSQPRQKILPETSCVAFTANFGEGPLCKEEEEEKLHIQPCPAGYPGEGQQAELKQEPEWEWQHFSGAVACTSGAAAANSGERPLCKEEKELHMLPCSAGDPEKGQKAKLKQEQEWEDPTEGLKIQCAWSMATKSEKLVYREQAWSESLLLTKDWLEEDLKMSQSQPGQKILPETICGTLGAAAANSGEGPLCKQEKEEEKLHMQPCPGGDPEKGTQAELKQEQDQEWGLKILGAWSMATKSEKPVDIHAWSESVLLSKDGLKEDLKMSQSQPGQKILPETSCGTLGAVAFTANFCEGPLCKEEEKEEEEKLHIQPCPAGYLEEGLQAELKQEPEWEGQHFSGSMAGTSGAAAANTGERPLCMEEKELHMLPCSAGDPEKEQQAELKQEQEWEDPTDGLKILCAWSMATKSEKPVDMEQAWSESALLSKDGLEEDLKMSQSQPGQGILSETSCGTLGAAASTANRGKGPLCKEEKELHMLPCPAGDPEKGKKAELKQEQEWKDPAEGLKIQCAWSMATKPETVQEMLRHQGGSSEDGGVRKPLVSQGERTGSAPRKASFDSSAEAKSFPSLFSSNTHRRVLTRQKPYNCDECGKGFTKLGHLKTHQKLHTGKKPHSCDECGKSFTLLCNLKTHQRIHTGEKPYSCSKCGKSFTQMVHLKNHQRVHTEEKLHRCSKCGESFTLLGNLKIHQRVHTGERPHSCDKCGKSFTLLGNLMIHQRVHTGEKPHSCDKCGKSFTNLGNLKTHQRIHTGEKAHSCSKCGKSFTQMSTLKTHQKFHTGEKPHSCDKCGKSFSHLGNLKSHQSVHTGEKPHSCSKCGKSFTRVSSLKTHQMLHNGEKPHSCDKCGKSFTRMDNLKTHQRVH